MAFSGRFDRKLEVEVVLSQVKTLVCSSMSQPGLDGRLQLRREEDKSINMQSRHKSTDFLADRNYAGVHTRRDFQQSLFSSKQKPQVSHSNKQKITVMLTLFGQKNNCDFLSFSASFYSVISALKWHYLNIRCLKIDLILQVFSMS